MTKPDERAEMKIRRKDSEDYDSLWDLLAEAITEDLAIVLYNTHSIEPSFNFKANMYEVIRKRFTEGVEI